MKDLFTLQDDEGNGSTETSNIFSQLSEDVNIGVPNDGQQDQAHIASALSSTSVAEPSNGGEGRVDINSDQADEESNILKSLFDAQGIHVSSIFLIPNKTSLCNASIF
jgi:DNA excision repair protein ERCC-6